GDRLRVQVHALVSRTREPPVQLEVPVLVVAGDRTTGVREVHADLVRAAGFETRLDEREAAQTGQIEACETAHVRDRIEPVTLDGDAAIAVGRLPALQRKGERA